MPNSSDNIDINKFSPPFILNNIEVINSIDQAIMRQRLSTD